MRKSVWALLLVASVIATAASFDVIGATKEKYRVATSPYVGWEPLVYAQYAGILKKWADKFDIEIEVTRVAKYGASIDQYTAGVYHALAITNMDVLIAPAAGGVDTTAVIVGDTSHGNDGVVLKNGKTCKDIKGRRVRLVVGSVSQYILSRMLTSCGLTLRDVKLVNTDDDKIATVFINDRDPRAAVVTWNPPLMEVRNAPRTTMIYDSSKIPGEIIDMIVVRTDAPDALKRALAGAWYETMTIMSGGSAARQNAIKYMARISPATVAEYEAQLQTTAMFYKAVDGVKFALSSDLKKTMEYVRTFAFENSLFDKSVRSPNHVGILFPDGTVMGDKNNVKLRFDANYMQLAAEGKL